MRRGKLDAAISGYLRGFADAEPFGDAEIRELGPVYGDSGQTRIAITRTVRAGMFVDSRGPGAAWRDGGAQLDEVVVRVLGWMPAEVRPLGGTHLMEVPYERDHGACSTAGA